MPPPSTPLLCLDTETTGLGSAAGTVAFLIGLAWWEGDRLRLLQLALPDHSEEGALLDALAAENPGNAWLVTYNGRSFDWPLLETRFRMNRDRPPATGGHLDLLLLVRRLFRHRLPDARLQTVERHLLRRHRARTFRRRRSPPSTTPSCAAVPLGRSESWPGTTPRMS